MQAPHGRSVTTEHVARERNVTTAAHESILFAHVNGLAIVRQPSEAGTWREDPATARIPVILCSAAANALDRHAVLVDGQGRVEAVPKPFDMDHRLGVFARLLEQRSAVVN
jgi:CheY-like chemotaxis protein